MWQDLTGSSTKQVTELISKVRTIHAAISKSPLPRHLNWIGLRQAIWKSIEYVLTATTLSREEAAQLAKELYRPLLPKLGCNRNFPLLLRYNPPFLLGKDHVVLNLVRMADYIEVVEENCGYTLA